jgi:DNA-binding Xre family transcriptional regulator
MSTAVLNKIEYKKENNLYFYTNLEALMAKKGLSVAELSEKTGVAQSTIRSLIRGRLKRLDSLSTGKLAQFFNCKLDDLYVMKWE